MEQQQLDFLLSESGREWSVRLREQKGDVHSRLRWLRKSLTPDEAAALVELERARASLSSRHDEAESLFLDSLAAAQASSQVVADWRARRFQDAGLVVDFCCGAGVDTLALTEHAAVLAIDASANRLRFAQANTQRTLHPVVLVRGRVPDCIGPAAFAFCDPDRRLDGKRIFDPRQASPSLDELLAMPVSDGMGIKLSPMAPLADLDGLGELEFISSGRELKEIVLWTKGLERGHRRVSLPEYGLELTGTVDQVTERSQTLGEWLFDPDPALTRSGLLGDHALSLGLRTLAEDIAYLTGDANPESPFLAARRIIGTSKTGPKALQKLVQAHDIGRLDISRRGFPQSPEEIRKRLRLKGSRPGHLHLTRFGEERVAILTEPAEQAI